MSANLLLVWSLCKNYSCGRRGASQGRERGLSAERDAATAEDTAFVFAEKVEGLVEREPDSGCVGCGVINSLLDLARRQDRRMLFPSRVFRQRVRHFNKFVAIEPANRNVQRG